MSLAQWGYGRRARLNRRELGADVQKPTLDVWLLRLSHIAQFGLFLITVGALYFTVLPLYQKAVLEETIARREVELKQANKEIEKAYVGVRKFVIREFVFFAGAECSGLFGEDDPPLKLGERRLRGKGLHERGFEIDVRKCLDAEIAKRNLAKELRDKDYKFFTDKVGELSRRLAENRKQALVERDRVPERARTNPDSIPPATGLRAEAIELSARFYSDLNRARVSGPELRPRESFEEQRRKLAIVVEQERFGLRYSEQIRKEIAALNDLKWPSD